MNTKLYVLWHLYAIDGCIHVIIACEDIGFCSLEEARGHYTAARIARKVSFCASENGGAYNHSTTVALLKIAEKLTPRKDITATTIIYLQAVIICGSA